MRPRALNDTHAWEGVHLHPHALAGAQRRRIWLYAFVLCTTLPWSGIVTVTALWHTNPVQGLWHTQTPFLGPSRFYARGARRPQRLGKQCGALCTIGSDRESSRALSVNSCECCFLGTECCAFLHHFFNFLLPPTPSSARVLASSHLARARENFESRFAIDAGRRARQESFRVPGSKARDVGPLPRFLAFRFCGIGRRSSPRAAHPYVSAFRTAYPK